MRDGCDDGRLVLEFRVVAGIGEIVVDGEGGGGADEGTTKTEQEVLFGLGRLEPGLAIGGAEDGEESAGLEAGGWLLHSPSEAGREAEMGGPRCEEEWRAAVAETAGRLLLQRGRLQSRQAAEIEVKEGFFKTGVTRHKDGADVDLGVSGEGSSVISLVGKKKTGR